MSFELDDTHDPSLNSWLPSANVPDTDYPIQNLPFAVFRRQGAGETWRGGVAIGDQIVDLAALAEGDLLDPVSENALKAAAEPTLNRLMGMGREGAPVLRKALSQSLRANAPAWPPGYLVDQSEAEFNLPAVIGDYTDFYTSIHHASRVGALFRPDAPLLPNYKWVPIGYHGRSSSIGVSGQAFHRPMGQRMGQGGTAPTLGPCERLDYELELAAYVAAGNTAGRRIGIDDAESHLFGVSLLNDWSARDLQAWEYQPLGPFLAKNFASTVSPWIVTLDALTPFRRPWQRDQADPAPLPYLDSVQHRARSAFDISLRVSLRTAAMRERGEPAFVLSRSNFRDAYWSLAQMLTHHSVNGCPMRPGDLLGTGTQSGPELAESGSLLELTRGGQQALNLPGGEERRFLQDGDEVTFTAWCEAPGARRIGLGQVAGTVLPALPFADNGS